MYSLDLHKVLTGFRDPEDGEVHVECERLEVAGRILQPLDWKRIYGFESNLQLPGDEELEIVHDFSIGACGFFFRCDIRFPRWQALNSPVNSVERAGQARKKLKASERAPMDV